MDCNETSITHAAVVHVAATRERQSTIDESAPVTHRADPWIQDPALEPKVNPRRLDRVVQVGNNLAWSWQTTVVNDHRYISHRLTAQVRTCTYLQWHRTVATNGCFGEMLTERQTQREYGSHTSKHSLPNTHPQTLILKH